jgi:hypothetical protein
MSATSIYGIVDNETRTNVLIGRLRDRGIGLEEISVLFPDLSTAPGLASIAASMTSAIQPLQSGGVVGGALGWLTGIGQVNVPGVGALIVSGPLLMALSSLANPERLNGIADTLIALGFAEHLAQTYAEKLESGCILVAVHARAAQAAEQIQAIFALTNVRDVGTAGEVTADSTRLDPAHHAATHAAGQE